VVSWLRLALVAVAVAICCPSGLRAWLVSDADTTPPGLAFHRAPPDRDEAAPATGAVIEVDDDDDAGECLGEDGFVPVVSSGGVAPGPRSVWVLAAGLTAASGVPGSLFRPPRAIG
jgi:hypothetical protein